MLDASPPGVVSWDRWTGQWIVPGSPLKTDVGRGCGDHRKAVLLVPGICRRSRLS